MNLDYALTLIISTAISAAIALIAWRRRAAPGASGLALLMLSFTVWSLTYAIRWMSSTQTAQYFWLDATYFGAVTVPLFLTVFTLQFTNRAHLLTRRNLILLSIEPVLTLLLLWTDHWHGLFYGGFRSTGTILNGGPWFWFNVLYSYTLNFMMLGLFIQAYRRASLLFRRQAGIILAGVLIPFVGNAISLGGLNPFHDLDLTPILFIVSGLVYAFGLFRYQLMDVLPVARGQLIENMRDGLIVLDAQNRIVDINPAAQEMTGVSSSEVGKSAGITFSAWPGLAEIYSAVIETHTEISVSQNPPRDLEVRVSPLFDLQQNLSGQLIVLRDITERKQAEVALRASHDFNQSLLQTIPFAIDIVDQEGNLLYIDPATEKSIGGQMLGKKCWQFYKDDRQQCADCPLNKPIQIGETKSIESSGVLGGKIFEITHTGMMYQGKQAILEVFHDISERKQAEEKYRRSESNLKKAQSVARLGNWEWDLKTSEVSWSDEMYQIFGIDKDSFTGRLGDVITKVIHPDDLHLVLPANASAFAEKKPIEYRIILPDQSIHNIWAKFGDVILDEHGNPAYMTGIAQDITESKRVEEALQASETRYSLTFAAVNNGLWDWNVSSGNAYFSVLYYTMLGYEDGEFPASYAAWRVLVHPQDLGHVEQVLQQSIENGNGFEIDLRMKTKSDAWLWVCTRGKTVESDVQGKALRLVGTLSDITERKRIEEAEREQRLLAEALRDTAAALNGTLQFDAVLDRILNSVGRVVSHDADAVMIFLLDEAREIAQLVRYHSANDFGDTVKMKGFQFLLSQTRNLREVQMTGAPLIIADTHMYDEWNVTPLTTWIRSNLSAPIMIRGEVVGFLNLASATPNSFTPLDVEHLQVFADQASVAIQNARLYEEVQELAITDGLTKIYNRRGLFQLGEREVERALRFRHSLSIIMLDLDHFKRVNDTHGHLIGDHVLSALAERCRAQVRNVDIAARYGGEEFILLLLETEVAGAAQVAERLRQAVENMVISAEADENEIGKTVQITVSQGIATLTPDMQNLTDLIARADQVMYAAKQAGRNRVVIFEHK